MAEHLSLVLLLTSTVTNAANSWNSFPITPKSINYDEASIISYYKLITPENLEDPHAVVGNPVKLGGYVLAGKAMECGDECTGGQVNTKTESFATKHDAIGNVIWKWSSNNPGKSDAANGILELPSGDVLVVGWRAVGTIGYRYITKLAGATGTEIWTFSSFGDSAGKYFKRRRACIAYMESTVDFHLYSSSLFQTCFIVFVTYLLYSKITPTSLFLTQ